ncbi:protein RRP5 homolog [Lineus longissimus]|uniref:protein RRP5 homolog n=1 Tax=Lineus longissimus TaxID=88925 RepID=UPI002B4DF32A
MTSEEDFPRGGSLRKAPPSGRSAKAKHKKEIPDLFKVTSTETEKPGKKRKRRDEDGVKRKKRKMVEVGGIDVTKTAESQIQELSFRMIGEGMRVLGRVRAIREYDMDVGLPNGLMGTVPLTGICQTYTKQLQALASEDEELVEGVHGLNELFHVGDVVRCIVTAVVNRKKERDLIQLSLDPNLVNQNVQTKALSGDMVLCGCVESVEDHGYTVDIGIKGLKAFLSSKGAATYIRSKNQGKPLFIGQYLQCVLKNYSALELKSGETRVVGIGVDIKAVGEAVVSPAEGREFQSLVPGMKVAATVSKSTPAGLLVKFLGRYKGYVEKRHLPGSPMMYEKSQQVTACILYVQPISKAVSLSLLPHLCQGASPEFDQHTAYKVGDVIEEATVKTIENKRGAWLKLENNIKGFVSIKQVSDAETKDVAKYVKKGSAIKCRITGYDLMDNVAIVTMKPSILNQKYVSLNDIVPGSLVECTVKKLVKFGVVVKVTNQIRGFIPSMHLAEVMLKHPEKKFTEGKELKCRVLSVLSEDNKLILTNKKSLIQTELPVLTSFDQLEQGLTVEGYIVKVMSAGVVVAFYNGVKGFVPKRELSFEKIDYPEKVFYSGQVVKSRILNWNAEDERITLSFKLGVEDITQSSKLRQMKGAEKIEIGQIVDCEVKGRSDSGLDVYIEDLKIKAFISKKHLSDFQENCHLLLNTYSVGEVIKDAMCLSKSGSVSLTLKHSLVSASQEGILPKTFADLQLGLMFPGIVKNTMPYGIFVDLLGNISGLVPNWYLGDDRLPEGTPPPFQRQQTLVTKVIEVDHEKKRCLLSSRMFDCYHGDTDVGIELLSKFLEERKKIVDTFQNAQKKKKKKPKFGGLKVGELCTATVTKMTDHGAICQLERGASGIVTLQHLKDTDCKPGDRVEALILYIDTVAKCVELSINPGLIKAIRHRKENKFTAIRERQELQTEVVLVKDEFVLVMLKAHGAGKLAYLPAKRHLNDVFEKPQFEVSQINRVIIKRVEEDMILASWYMHEEALQKRNLKNSLSAPSKVDRHDLKLGDVVTGRINEVLPFQLNIRIVRTPARVFVSEASDDVIMDGATPLSGFKVNQEVKVKIIGFRDVKTQKRVQSLSALKFKKSIPECTLKKSKLQEIGSQLSDAIPKKFEVGDVVPAFFQHFDGNCLWMRITPECRGRVYILNASSDLDILNNPPSHFEIGHGYNATVIKAKGESLELSLVSNYEVVPGAVVNSWITDVKPSHLRLQLPGSHWGNVAITDLDDAYSEKPLENYKVDQFVKCYIKTCTDDRYCTLSLRKSRVESSSKVKDVEIKSLSDLHPGTVLRGFIRSCTSKGAFVSLAADVVGHVDAPYLSEWYFIDLSKVFYTGKVVTAKVLSINADERKVTLSLLEKDTGVAESIDEVYKITKRKATSKKRKIANQDDAAKRLKLAHDSDSGIDDQKDDVGVDSESEDEVTEKTTKSRLNLSSGFTWDNSFSLPTVTSGRKEESSDDESDVEPEKMAVKKTKEVKRAERRAEEKKLYETENLYLDNERLPETVEDFDRLCVQSPDSSLVWLRYMAFHLETAEIEKARAVAERALKCISFREEQEKLNVWVGYLNLENMYGTAETLQTLFQRAIQHNDPLKVYQQLIAIYEKSEKIEAAEQSYHTMVKRFSLRTDVWVNFGLFYFRNNKLESARKLMQRALASLKSLEKKHHVEIIAKFAQMEFKLGEPERGTTMFENILSNYPKRTDLWSVYIDMLTKKGDTDAVRAVFERVINLSVSAKRMKFFFKKYLDFEKKFGTEESVAEVKQKALEYVETKATELDL